jgi:hypothetical protein
MNVKGPGPRKREVDVVRVRSLYLEGGMSFDRVAIIIGNETGRPITSGTVRARYLEAGGKLRNRPTSGRGGRPAVT